MPKPVQAYQCSWCGMVSLTRANVLRHERQYCQKNEQRQSCHTCRNLSQEYGADSNGASVGAEYVCLVDEPLFHGHFITNCPSWESARSNG